jgi:hypothetical protein
MITIVHAPRAKGVRMRWNGPGGRIAYLAKSLRGKDKYSCEKPLDLMLALVSDLSDPGELVIDPCAGVGTTCLAATLLGREALGFEALPDVVDVAAERCAGAAAGLSPRDTERALRWAEETWDEAERTPAPKAANGSDVKTFERAQRRKADVQYLTNHPALSRGPEE